MTLFWILIALVYFINNLVIALGYRHGGGKRSIGLLLLFFGLPYLVFALIMALVKKEDEHEGD